jgi:hypothetical protein
MERQVQEKNTVQYNTLVLSNCAARGATEGGEMKDEVLQKKREKKKYLLCPFIHYIYIYIEITCAAFNNATYTTMG